MGYDGQMDRERLEQLEQELGFNNVIRALLYCSRTWCDQSRINRGERPPPFEVHLQRSADHLKLAGHRNAE